MDNSCKPYEFEEKKEETKVYCNNCRYFIDYLDKCVKAISFEYTPKEIISTVLDYKKDNKDNNCKYYKTKGWFQKFLEITGY